MSKHTPGPWEAREHSDGSHWFVDWDGGWTAGDELSEANARLIAAAPELLEACEACFGMLYLATDVIDKARRQQWDGVRCTDLHVIDLQTCRNTYNAARAAIAKATGENK